jgi:hypothetical protein
MAVFQRKGRDEMKGYHVYSKVHQMRTAGFSHRAILGNIVFAQYSFFGGEV